MRIGLIVGAGQLPHSVLQGAIESGHDVFIAALSGFARHSDFENIGDTFSIGEIGRIINVFKQRECSHVCFAGIVKRPNFKDLRPDAKGLRYLPGAIKAAADGDDSILRYILAVFEKEGFTVVSPQELCRNILLKAGHVGRMEMQEKHKADAEKACRIATAIGALDIGQGAVVCNGLVLAVEAQEGTDEMLKRVAQLPIELRGSVDNRMGVLAKILKPDQDRRVDLPTIGLRTIELAVEAGLSGIVAEAGQAFILDERAVITAADQAGVFIAGLPSLKL